MIRLENVEKVYRTTRIETVALSGINLTVGEGEFVSVMGPSGCGKTTLLNIIGLLDIPSSGSVQINGSPVSSYADRHVAALRNQAIGFVFQTFHLVSDLSVIDNVQIPLLYRRMSNRQRRQLAPCEVGVRRDVIEIEADRRGRLRRHAPARGTQRPSRSASLPSPFSTSRVCPPDPMNVAIRSRAAVVATAWLKQCASSRSPSTTPGSAASTARFANAIASAGNDAIRCASRSTNGPSSSGGRARLR